MLGVIHKATEGTTFIDDVRAENLANAKKAGLAIAGSSQGTAQRRPSSICRPSIPSRASVVIDYEEGGCSLTTLHNAVQALLDYRSDLQITVYSGHLLKEQFGDERDPFLAESTDLWLAQYASASSISWPSGTYPQWALWQYSESGEVPGINDSYVDLDNYNGAAVQFLNWINPKGSAQPLPPEPPDGEMVNVAITAPKNVSVPVSVNGGIARRRWIKRHAKRGPDTLR